MPSTTTAQLCRKCNGSGHVKKGKPCARCKGTGQWAPPVEQEG